MHGFTSDGAHLVFQDGFGLTRITFPKGVKTDRDAAGAWLSVGDAYALAHTPKSNRMALRALPGLTRAKWPFSDYSHFVLFPDGVRGVEISNKGGQLLDVTSGHLGAFTWPDDMPSVGELDLGRQRPAGTVVRGRAATGPDGALAVFNGYFKRVWFGRVKDDGSCEPVWQADVGLPVGEVILHAGEGETFVGAFDPGRGEARIYRVTDDREVTTRAVACVGAPTYSGDRWCWQESAEVVCRAPWTSMDAPERFTLPSAAQGVGELMAHGDRLLFLPRDGERVYDVVTGAAIDRKLPAGDKSLRAKVTKAVETFGPWLAAEGGGLRFGHASRDKQGHDWWSPTFDVGAGTFSAFIAVGELLGRQGHSSGEPDALRVGSYSAASGITHVTLDVARRAFAALDAREGRLPRALCGLEFALRAYFEPPYNDRSRRGLAPPERLFEPRAAAAIFRALAETASKGETVPLTENLDRWAATPITADELLARDPPEGSWDATSPFLGASSLPLVTAYLALDALRAESAPVLARWMVTRPTAYARSNSHIIHEPAARMIQYFPEAEAAFMAACEGDAQGEQIKRSLAMTLRG